MPILIVALMAFVGWQSIWVLAALTSVGAIPLIVNLLRQERAPQSSSDDTVQTGLDNRHWRRIDALRHPLFWLMVPFSIGPSMLITALFFQQVHLAQIKDWSHSAFVSLFPLYSLCAVIFMLLVGIIVDRISARRILAITQLPIAVGFGLIWLADGLALGALGMVMMGIGQGVSACAPIAFWSETYGTKYLGSIKAALTAITVLGSAIGPIITSMLIDRGIDFVAQLPAITLYIVLVWVLSHFAIKRYCGS